MYLGFLSSRCWAVWRLVRANLFLTAYATMLIVSVWPTRFACNYESIDATEVFDQMWQQTTGNMSKASDTLPVCSSYRALIGDNRFFYRAQFRDDIIQPSDIRPGGEYWPADCAPLFSTAIIVVYRKRERQLSAFLNYIHNYLRKQNVHYRLFVVEQNDKRPFNRAMLFNIGFEYARRLGFPCVVLHDVDLMPMRLGQLYACTRDPRHMCASLDEFRFNLPYRGLFGGAVAMRSEHFERINGFSNMFSGWGGEDDDLYARLRDAGLDVVRLPAAHSQYAMLLHAKETPNPERMTFLRTGSMRFRTDGLNSLQYVEREYQEHALFTHIRVDTCCWPGIELPKPNM